MFLLEIIRSAGEMGKAGELRFIVSVLCLDTKGAFDHVDHARLIEALRKREYWVNGMPSTPCGAIRPLCSLISAFQ
jgi:hypothetical protein